MAILLAAGALLLVLALLAAVALPWRPAPRLPERPEGPWPKVSVIVPARDEAENLPRLLESLARLEGVDHEVIVVEGGSRDGTRALADAFAARDPRVRVVDEPPLPPGWVGKSWACWNGRKAARGAWLLFTDADTAHAPESLARALAGARETGARFVTGLTRQELGTFAEAVAMPPIFLLIRTAARGAGPDALRDPEHAIANGQYLLFEAAAYDALGGHEAVKGTVVEDLALARLAAARGVPAAFFDLGDAVRVRMYRGLRAMAGGWRKNVATGAARTPPAAFALTAATFAAGLLAGPLALAALALREWGAALLLACAWGVTAWRVRQAQAGAEGAGWPAAALHPLGFAFFGAVLLASAWDRVSGRGPTWKGRRYAAR